MEASQQFEDILDAVMRSQLNFQLQLSPFSALISIKKSLAKDKFGRTLRQKARLTSSQARDCEDVNKFNNLEIKIKDLLAQNEKLAKENSKLGETAEILESKVTKVEATALKVFENHKVEVDALKKQVKFLNNEVDARKKEIHSLKKSNKEKDKELFKAENKSENLEGSVKRLKTEISTLKNSNKRLSKEKFPNTHKTDNRVYCVMQIMISCPNFSD